MSAHTEKPHKLLFLKVPPTSTPTLNGASDSVMSNCFHHVVPDYAQHSGWDHRIPGIAAFEGPWASWDRGHPCPRGPRQAFGRPRAGSPSSQEARAPRRPATPGSRGIGPRIVRNQNVIWTIPCTCFSRPIALRQESRKRQGTNSGLNTRPLRLAISTRQDNRRRTCEPIPTPMCHGRRTRRCYS